MLTAALALALSASPLQEAPAPVAQDAGVGQAEAAQTPPVPDPAVVSLEDVVVVAGRPLAEATVDFVERVAAPPRDRGAATWDRRVCVGVGNLQRDTAEYVIDRISTVAESVGLQAGWPRCEPRVFILFAADADAAARGVVRARGRGFRIGVAGSDLGRDAMAAFQSSDRPVRWWQSSVPVDSETGRATERLPGMPPFSAYRLTSPNDLGERAVRAFGSRLRSPLRDALSQVIIIVDVDQVEGVDIGALSDYLAMISLAQIDPDVDPGPYDSILGLFAPGQSPPASLTDWDLAYLRGLYNAEQTADNPRARVGDVAASMARSVRARQRGEDSGDQDPDGPR